MPEVAIEEARRFMEESLQSVGTPAQQAKDHAALLLHADMTGHFSHGLNRLELYINDIRSGATDAKAQPVVLKQKGATAWVDGCDGLGATVGNFCMDLAIKKAKEVGVGWVAAKRCNHFGMAGWWAEKAKSEGLIGMAFTNTSPILVPTRAKQSALGTNPLAMSAPAKNGDFLSVDMASTAVAVGKIEVQIHKGEPIPDGWALGPDGKPTNDAQVAFKTGRLLPLGGFEQTSGYKGYGLSAMVEAFCSGLSGSNSTHNIRSWALKSDEGSPNLGQCFVAIDPECFAPCFGERMADCLQHWRNMEPVDPSLPVLAPGDKERINEEKTKKKGTITYAPNQILHCNELAKKLNIKPIQVL
ncbi:uncharacterized oxidoreductase YjmC [Pectinophora gossypiella]|uniref:uncharacterized oxidoreductase YjmC n=1 Tax=Pectinophora gossypiella TaxID=13191 RepID=UPI00214F3B01|nr:uncharacterized oxidoreductase YjmC [Pectinophora gossypiella]XP_049876986.1 uncharacterized oxidoreductase YjmC [Pectinophora gossypiella]XP_049876987.1 uncharacterized oxidoreductase YjmC [Pectinophora gossypiella]XP_049876988.1 uncharacterized oxidoreductase YjmC [Pectinophora gossypiella]XP_049876989.1 uncharacterized oxidoreductase YjmC [Pectinophora gossypiella]